MKRKFLQIAKSHDATISEYRTYREPGMGGLQVFRIAYELPDGGKKTFDDSYFHLSGDAHKVLEQFEKEVAANSLHAKGRKLQTA
jgi:hypothetical protein